MPTHDVEVVTLTRHQYEGLMIAADANLKRRDALGAIMEIASSEITDPTSARGARYLSELHGVIADIRDVAEHALGG